MEDFVRRWNMDGYDREWPPLPSLSDGDRRGVTNEAGFILFAILRGQAIGEAAPTDDLGKVTRAFSDAARYVYGPKEWEKHDKFSTTEKREAFAIAGRLLNFFSREKNVKIWPDFKGSGIISNCRGDVLVDGDVLYEIKSGERNFRSVDYRQLVMYATLYFAYKRHTLKKVGLINPRMGTHIIVDIEIFANEISGQSSVTLFQSVIESFSANLVSL